MTSTPDRERPREASPNARHVPARPRTLATVLLAAMLRLNRDATAAERTREITAD